MSFFLPRGEKLVWRIFFLHFISHFFWSSELCSIGLQKTNAASGWSVQKYISVKYCDFLTPTNAVR
jgi:hypothetical protein